MINTDRAISDKKDDVLGRAAFSENLAKAIVEYNSKDSLVIGLEGAWGTGKTSIVNMVCQALKKEEKVVLIKFNPWDYSDHESLYRQFFQNISLSLKPFKTKFRKGSVKIWAWFLRILSILSTPVSWVYPLYPIQGIVRGLEKLSSNTSALTTEKPKIQRLLGKIDGKIVIVIDDIDRLNAQEIRQIFQIVKSLGDFPNIVYLLAFDRNIVVEALAKVQTEKGHDYLEKIIQMPVVVPHVSKEQIQPILFEKLDKVIADQAIDFTLLKNHWGEIYTAGLGNNFKTLRDLARFLNVLQIDFQLVKNEINFVDFIAISVFKVFSPSLYSAIKENKGLFTKEKDAHSLKTDQDDSETQMLNKILSIDPKQKDLVLALFPVVKNKIGTNSWGYNSDNARLNKLVSSETFFDVYFQLSLPSGHIPQYLIDSFLGIESKEDYEKFFLELKEKGNIKEFLTRFEDFTNDNGIKKENIPNLISAIFDIADLVPDDAAPMSFDFGNSTRFGRIIYQLQSKRSITQDEYFEMVKTAIQNSKQGIDFIVREIGHWGSYYRESDKRYEPPFTKNQSVELEKMGLEKIKKAAKEDKFKNIENIYNILFRWKEWEGDKEPKKYVETVIKTQGGLINFLKQTLSVSYSSTGYEVEKKEYFEFKSLSHFVPPETLKKKVSKISETEENKALLKVFNESYEKWQKSNEVNKTPQ